MKKIDITSTTLEKGLDIAKVFVEKLIYPSAEEMGLLISDGITKWRFKNQIKTLVMTKEICEKNNIKPKIISSKLLTPLLEYASLEDSDKLQNKWATLLSNMVDSEQNVENHVFPYLLSQISINEFEILEKTLNSKLIRVKLLETKLKEHLEIKKDKMSSYSFKIEELEKKINTIKQNNINGRFGYTEYFNFENTLNELKTKMNSFKREESRINKALNDTELI